MFRRRQIRHARRNSKTVTKSWIRLAGFGEFHCLSYQETISCAKAVMSRFSLSRPFLALQHGRAPRARSRHFSRDQHTGSRHCGLDRSSRHSPPPAPRGPGGRQRANLPRRHRGLPLRLLPADHRYDRTRFHQCRQRRATDRRRFAGCLCAGHAVGPEVTLQLAGSAAIHSRQ